MKSFPPLLIVAGLLAIVLGLPIGFYLLLTRGQRRTTREIRKSASRLGWKYRLRRWQGNPTAFRIDGQTSNALTWILTSSTASDYARGWTVLLALRFPTLGGESDFAIMPRDDEGRSLPRGPAIPAGIESGIAVFSGAAARDIAFLRDARQHPSGLAAFDTAYQVLATPERLVPPPVDPELAARLLRWPADAVAPHSVLAWRDPFALHLQVRLPGPPNWATVAYTAQLGADLAARVPPRVMQAAPRTSLDRLIARFQK
jgi:hypothetical protein